MPLKTYGVLKGRPISKRLGSGSSPHYQIHVVDNTTDYRIAINVKSSLSPSDLLYLMVDDFRHPLLEELPGLRTGFSQLPSTPGGAALDYIRGNLFLRDDLRPLPHAIPGPDNDLNEKIDAYVERAIGDERATIYAFGERWGPEPQIKDKYFGFLPGNGIHDIHMNQGNVGQFVGDDGVWQDGGLILHYPAILDENGLEVWPEQWTALFLAFQSQSFHTDDVTGHSLGGVAPGDGPTPLPGDRDGQVRIAAALVNPPGDDTGHETVTLINASPIAIDLTGWSIADRNKNKSPVPAGELAAGRTLLIALPVQGAQLSNKGGIISLLDAGGIKIDGVSYTSVQARRQGWTVVF